MNNELESRLKEINNENIIFGIFIILVILSYIANDYEKRYFLNRLEKDKDRYRYIMIIVFIVVVIVNIYYVIGSYDEVKTLKYEGYSNRKKFGNLNFIASIVALIAGIILLYIAITDTDIEAEISL